MKIDRVVTGFLEENCYILEKNNKVLVVDPGDDSKKILDKLKDKEVLKVLVTHNHYDHIGALSNLISIKKVEVMDYSNLEEKVYEVGPFKFRVIYTKGHSKDSVTYYFEEDNVMFVGDFIFEGTIGRCDLEGGNYLEMKNSLNIIKTYPLSTVIYPGHGNRTILGDEIKYNPYFEN